MNEVDDADPVQRLTNALEVYLAHRRQPTASQAEFLARHEPLRDLLEPMFVAPSGADEPTVRTFGPFQLLGEIARGGMGVVHDALHVGLNRRVALKVLANPLAASPQALVRFRREAELLARLEHAHIVPVHDAGVIDGVPYFAMERVEGGTLADVMRALAEVPEDNAPDSLVRAHQRALGDPTAGAWLLGRSHLDACLRVVLAIADALQLAHAQGILHRDVKPANVLLRRDGLPKLSDFGLARVEQEPRLSRAGDFAGTPYYVAPEQADGDGARVGPATDVFALAVVAYEMLFRERPFDGETTAQVLDRVRHADPKRLLRAGSGLPADLVAVLDKALRKDPADRYPTIEVFADELRAVRDLRPVRARRRGAVTRAWQRIRARPGRALRVAIVGGCLLLAGGSAAYLASQQLRLAAITEQERLPRVEFLLQTMLLLQECGGAGNSGLEVAREANRLLPLLPETLLAVHVAARLEGDDATSREFLAKLQQAAPDVAIQVTAGGLAPEPDSPLGWFVRGLRLLDDAHHDGGQAGYRDAANCFRRAMDRVQVPREMYHCELLHALMHLRDLPAAKALCADMSYRWPDSPFGAYWRGRALEDIEPESAVAELERAVVALPDLPQPMSRLAQVHETALQFAVALPLYERVLARWPHHANAHLGVACCYLGLDRADDALLAADRAVAAAPRNYWSHVVRGQVLRKLGRFDEAFAAYETAITLGPKAALPLRARAELRLAIDQPTAALVDAELACALEPGNTAAQSCRGLALLHCARPKDAVAALELVVADWPRSADNWRALAQARRRDGALAAAADAIATAMRLAPDDLMNRRELGKVQRAAGHSLLAEGTFRSLLAAVPDDYEAAVNLAGLCWERGDREGAAELLAMARTTRPELPDAWGPSLQLLDELGRPRQAMQVRALQVATRPQERAGRLDLVERLLKLPPEPGDAELLQRTFAELRMLDGAERADVAALRVRAATR